MKNTAVATRTETGVVQEFSPMTVAEHQRQINTILEIMGSVMKKGVHYDILPGCKQTSLLKSGAEKIAVTFHLCIKPVQVEDLSTPDVMRFRVHSTCYTSTGRELGGAVGECSSDEEKYKWRKPVCNEEYEETPAGLKRDKWCHGKGGKAYKQKQIKTDPATLANTILQMADKRSYVAVVRRCTAASDIFTQDIQDLPPEYIQEDDHDKPATQQQQPDPQPKHKPENGNGNGHGNSDPLKPGMLSTVEKYIAKTKNPDAVKADVCKAFSVADLKDLPCSEINNIIDMVKNEIPF